jgi:NADH-ubiquinone oxidoreductase chain 2
MQYSISNLNAFIILISIGYSFYFYVNNSDEYKELPEKNNSPVQLISQLKGYFFINPVLSLSFTITIFSFVGIPPLIGFFAKQMVLSAALDSGYVFLTLVAILTSVISAVYYLNIIKQLFFDKTDYIINSQLDNDGIEANVTNKEKVYIEELKLNTKDIILSSYLTITISILTLIILLFILIPQE